MLEMTRILSPKPRVYLPPGKATKIILVDIIKNVLIKKCFFRPRDLVVIGHARGGATSLIAAAIWHKIEFGGVISIAGGLPEDIPLRDTQKPKTPTLLLQDVTGIVDESGLQQIRKHFDCIFPCINLPSDELPQTPPSLVPIFEFLGHRLRQDEWIQQSVLSLGINSLYC